MTTTQNELPANVIDARAFFGNIEITARIRTREVAPVAAPAPAVDFPFHAALFAVNIDKVPVMATDRCIPRKEQAALARKLLSKLGIKGVSITAPNYSMAQSVNVQMPRRTDYLDDRLLMADLLLRCPARTANTEARSKLLQILGAAFPNHDDRSDSQSDYFDYCWSVNC